MLLRSITGISLVLAVLTFLADGFLAAVGTFIGWWLGLALLAFLFLVLVSYGIPVGTLEAEREEDSPFHRWVASLYVEVLIMALRVRVKASGLEKTPKDGRFLLVCNHQFVADPGILLHYFRNSQLAFISKKENKDLFCIGPLMHMMLCQCIDRADDRQALQVILKCIRILKENKASVAVFPEGGTNHDELLHPFRPGVFKIAQKAQVPIVVCTLRNTRPIIRNGLRLKRTDVELKLLEVIPAESLKGRTAVDISNQVYRLMADDLGPALIAEECPSACQSSGHFSWTSPFSTGSCRGGH